MDLRDLGRLFAEMYERSRPDLPDEDPARAVGDRGVRLELTFQGAALATCALVRLVPGRWRQLVRGAPGVGEQPLLRRRVAGHGHLRCE